MERMTVVQERNGQAQEKRTTKALLEGPEYQWRKGAGGWVVETPSGGCYQVSEKGECSCEDYKRTCCGRELRCKHAVALNHHLLTLETTTPAAKPKGLPLMTDAEVSRWDRFYQ